jgi:hypothetical protein
VLRLLDGLVKVRNLTADPHASVSRLHSDRRVARNLVGDHVRREWFPHGVISPAGLMIIAVLRAPLYQADRPEAACEDIRTSEASVTALIGSAY